jgi:hypothetical protein
VEQVPSVLHKTTRHRQAPDKLLSHTGAQPERACLTWSRLQTSLPLSREHLRPLISPLKANLNTLGGDPPILMEEPYEST